MALLESLFVWANLPYVIVFTVAILFALLQMTGLLGLLAGGSDHDADADADHDLDHDLDHDVDADADADADGDHDADHDADGDHENDSSFGDKVLVDLGVGRIPFSILWQTFAVAFGIAGLSVNALFVARMGPLAAWTLSYTLPASLFIAWIVTRTASRLLGKIVGVEEETTSRHGLIGASGVVISSRITDEFGEIRAKDRAGHNVHVVCRIREGEAPIDSGREVVIIDYDAQKGHLYVAPLDLDPPVKPVAAAPSGARIAAGPKAADRAAEAEAEAAEIADESRNQRKNAPR